MKTANC